MRRSRSFDVCFVVQSSYKQMIECMTLQGECYDYLWLDILRIIELGLINPVVGLLGFGILDLLGREEVPVISQ